MRKVALGEDFKVDNWVSANLLTQFDIIMQVSRKMNIIFVDIYIWRAII